MMSSPDESIACPCNACDNFALGEDEFCVECIHKGCADQIEPACQDDVRLITDGGRQETGDEHREPLGDASEVYNGFVEVPSTWRVEGPQMYVGDEAGPAATIQVDEVHNCKVALSTTATERSTEFAALAVLGPEDARRLGNTLLRAADYADRQKEEGPDAE